MGRAEQECSVQRPSGDTHKARQSPTKTGAVARYVHVPILNISVQGLTKINQGHAPERYQAEMDQAEQREQAEPPPLQSNKNKKDRWAGVQAEQPEM